MSFVIDTDICSIYLKGNRQLFNRFLQYAGGLSISAITLAELYSWAFRTAMSPQRLASVKSLLDSVDLIGVDSDIAATAGEIRARMLDRGLVLPLPDILIASTALVFNFTMVTHNIRHFAMVPSLRLVDWLIP